jgi:DNA-binding CsgD family transcriptional regulator
MSTQGQSVAVAATKADAEKLKGLWRVAVMIVTYWMIFTVSRDLALDGGQDSGLAVFVVFIVATVAAAAVVFIYLLFSRRISTLSILQIVAPLCCAALLLTGLDEANLKTLAFTLSFIATIVLDSYVWIQATALARDGRMSVSSSIGEARFAVQGGGFLGVCLLQFASGIPMQALLGAMLFAVVVATMVALSFIDGGIVEKTETPGKDDMTGYPDVSGEPGQSESSASSMSTGLAQALTSIGVEYGLSAREQEVLALLGKGRDAPYIREALFISRNTVNTHVKHIYQKLDIHSKQELLDLLDKVAGCT